MGRAPTRAVFADRDGTVIEDPGYLTDPAGVRLVPGAAEALAELSARGFCLVVVSNQSGIGRGLITTAEAEAVHERFVSELARRGVRLDDVRYCPHAPDEGCSCRKPLPGLLVDAARELGVDAEASFMVGDKPSDVEAGRRVGCTTIFLGPGVANGLDADHVARDWADVLRIVDRAPETAA